MGSHVKRTRDSRLIFSINRNLVNRNRDSARRYRDSILESAEAAISASTRASRKAERILVLVYRSDFGNKSDGRRLES